MTGRHPSGAKTHQFWNTVRKVRKDDGVAGKEIEGKHRKPAILEARSEILCARTSARTTNGILPRYVERLTREGLNTAVTSSKTRRQSIASNDCFDFAVGLHEKLEECADSVAP